MTSPLKVTVEIDTNYLIPLPKEQWWANCAHCDKPQARWRLIDPNVRVEGKEHPTFLLCAICFIYESNWGTNPERKKELEDTIQRLAREMKRSFLYDPAGRLLSSRDADDVLGSIALVSRQRQLRANLVKFKESA